MAVKQYSFGIKISFKKSNVAAHLRWLEYLAGDDFGKQILLKWQVPIHLSRLRKIAQEVLQEEIYKPYQQSSYTRTYNTLRAVTTRFLEGVAGSALFLDPTIIPAEGPIDGVKGQDPTKAYAAFFEEPRFNTFVPATAMPHRPFFAQLVETFQEEEERQALRSLRAAIKYNRPRTITQ